MFWSGCAKTPNPAVNADVPGTFVLLVSRCGGTPVTLYRQAAGRIDIPYVVYT